MIAQKKDRKLPEVNAGSMADIAFLLLIFFIVTTTIVSEDGIGFVLPPKKLPEDQTVIIHDRNLFKVLINSQNKLLVEDEPFQIRNLRKDAKLFIVNNGVNPALSDNPQEAVIALKADRGTDYEVFLQSLNELKAAYHELRAEEIGITHEEYLKLDLKKNSQHKRWYAAAKEKYPMRISIAEPTQFGDK